jgi:glutamyl-tRNA synthetase
MGLDWDEEIVFQGARLAEHVKWAERLARSGQTYEDDGAVRFRMPAETIVWNDIVHGSISFKGSDIPDWVVLRSDGTPTYNFSVVADDIDMTLTHVLRGDDHISNTPKQIAVYRALGIEPPQFGHVPMIHGTDGKKLSKRHGATAVGDYQSLGILPNALRNFLALLGWNPGDERELFFNIGELIEAFSLESIQKKSAVFDPTKLEWMNGQYLSRTDPEELVAIVSPILEKQYDIEVSGNEESITRIVAAVRERARTTLNLAKQTATRINAAWIERDEKAEKLLQKDLAGYREALALAFAALDTIDESDWLPGHLERALKDLAESNGLGLGKVMQPIRVALTGGTVSEPVNDLLYVVGKDEALNRMTAARDWKPIGG